MRSQVEFFLIPCDRKKIHTVRKSHVETRSRTFDERRGEMYVYGVSPPNKDLLYLYFLLQKLNAPAVLKPPKERKPSKKEGGSPGKSSSLPAVLYRSDSVPSATQLEFSALVMNSLHFTVYTYFYCAVETFRCCWRKGIFFFFSLFGLLCTEALNLHAVKILFGPKIAYLSLFGVTWLVTLEATSSHVTLGS